MQEFKVGDKVRYKGGCTKSDHEPEIAKFGEVIKDKYVVSGLSIFCGEGTHCVSLDCWEKIVTEPELTLEGMVEEMETKMTISSDVYIAKEGKYVWQFSISEECYVIPKSLVDKYRPATKYTVKEAEDKLTKLEGKNVKIV